MNQLTSRIQYLLQTLLEYRADIKRLERLDSPYTPDPFTHQWGMSSFIDGVKSAEKSVNRQ